MATITSVVKDEHEDESSENGGLAMDLGEFEVSHYNTCEINGLETGHSVVLNTYRMILVDCHGV